MWIVDIGGDLYSSPALGENRVIYVGSEYPTGSDVEVENANLHAIDMKTGKVLWSYDFGSLPGADITWSSPAILDNGYLIIGRMSFNSDYGNLVYRKNRFVVRGRLHILQVEAHGLLMGAGSARFHEGNENTGRRPW